MAVDESTWDGAAAMSGCASSDDPAAAYAAICAGRRNGDPAVQSTWALPHHKAPGDPPNADGVRNSESRLPQTQGLINRDAAQRHLDAHMRAIQGQASAEDLQLLAEEHPLPNELAAKPAVTLEVGEHVQLDISTELVGVDASKRRLGVRLLPYNTVAVHPRYGALMFQPGAFFTDIATGAVDPSNVRLRMDHEDPPTGLGRAFTERTDAPYMEFQLSKTPRADEQLTLAKDGVSKGASVGFDEVPAKTRIQRIDGQNVKVYGPGSARLSEVSTTWQPTFAGAGVTYMLHKEQEGVALMGEAQETPAVGATITQVLDYDRLTAAILTATAEGERGEKIDKMLSAFDQMIEMQRAQYNVPQGTTRKPKLTDWVGVTLKRMAGEQISPALLKELAIDDIITTEQPGLVPATLVPDYDDLISQDRPFLNSTRQVSPPSAGTSMLLPLLTQRAAASTQGGGQKTEITTTQMRVGTGTFTYQAVFGAADVSIQMLLRAEQSFMDLLTAEMAEAYALDCETKALTALITGYTDSASAPHVPVDGGVMDPEDPDFGAAFKNSVTATKRRPTHIWLSVDGVAAFINAKAPLTNAPLYSNLAAAFTAGGGAGGVVSGLTPVYVPALDALAVDVIIGPSRGFVWAEDPAIRLSADNVSALGRDIGLAGGIFPAPRNADAFTTYTVAS